MPDTLKSDKNPTGLRSGALDILKERGFFKQCTDEVGLASALAAGPLNFYCGFDPTGPSLHVGHMVPLFAMAHLARAGNKPIALIGGGTARIGDPSGKTEMRRMLSVEQIEKNVESVRAQIQDFLTKAEVLGQTTVVDNAEWLAKLNYIDFLRDIGVHFSVNRMLTFEAYKLRMESGLSFIEFNYQLLQSYDFMLLNQRYGCRLQVGGDDQWGNIVAGADLIRRVAGGELHADEVFGLTFPLVTRSDGKKMGKTEKGALFLNPEMSSPFEFFQYWRNVPDADVGKFLSLFTFVDMDEVRRLSSLKDAEINVAKERLAVEITALVHGKAVADECLSAARAAFSGAAAGMDNVPSTTVAAADIRVGVGILDLALQTGLVPSKAEARRLVQQGGLFVGDGKVEDIGLVVDDDYWAQAEESDHSLLLRAGKKRVHRVIRG